MICFVICIAARANDAGISGTENDFILNLFTNDNNDKNNFLFLIRNRRFDNSQKFTTVDMFSRKDHNQPYSSFQKTIVFLYEDGDGIKPIPVKFFNNNTIKLVLDRNSKGISFNTGKIKEFFDYSIKYTLQQRSAIETLKQDYDIPGDYKAIQILYSGIEFVIFRKQNTQSTINTQSSIFGSLVGSKPMTGLENIPIVDAIIKKLSLAKS